MLTPGTTLGRYQIIAPIGAGGMGEVYRATDPRLKREVAIKVLPAGVGDDAERLHRFEQEALASAALNHPNILAVYDVGTENGSPFIVSELLQGETLRHRLQAGPLPLRKAVDYTAQIGRGLAAAHTRGILHRDLKPENIFITSEGQAKILDFGLAKLTASSPAGGEATRSLGSTPGMVVGTVGYISPEQVRGKPADPRSDLFALGAILYEMLTGQRAFRGETPADTLSAILTQDPPELAAAGAPVPPLLESLVRHCLEKQPEERFQSAHDVVFDLQQVSLSSSSRVVAQPASRRFRWRYALGIVGVLALLAAALLAGREWQAPPAVPSFRQLTYRRGIVSAARFLADGRTVVYSAAWTGSSANSSLFTTRTDLGGETSLGTDGEVLSISPSGEMLVLRKQKPVFAYARAGELDRMPISGGGPRPVTDDVQDAAWAPDGAIILARYANQRYRLEYPPGKILFETTGFVRAPRISPKTGEVAFLYHPVLGDDGGSVALLDRAGRMREISPRYPRINGLAWSPSGKELWFSAIAGIGNGGGLYAVNRKGQVRQIMAAPEQLILLDVAPSGSVLVASQRETATPMYSAPELPADRDVSVSQWTVGVDMTPDGKYLLLDDETSENYTAVLARSDGSPAVRLGSGEAIAISPNGEWVLLPTNSTPPQYQLLPTGAGEPRQFTHDNITHSRFAYWFPDSLRVLFTGSEAGHKPRAYLQDISGGAAQAVTPEGVTAGPVAPDGAHFVARDQNGASYLYTLDGSSRPVQLALSPAEHVHGWLDSRHAYFFTPPVVTAVYSLDVVTGQRQVVKRITVSDPAGMDTVVPVTIARDGKHCIYTIGRLLSDLHLVKGLR